MVEVPVGPLTYEDLAKLPEESGLRYELIDGVLLLTPSPVKSHQFAVLNLAILLKAAAPPDSAVMVAPFDWLINDWRVFEPDVFVIPNPAGQEKRFEGVPLLAVEVLSPSTRHRDLGIKLRAYEDAGLPWYWVVDPDEPSLTVFRLSGGRLVEEAKVSGDEVYNAVGPFPVTVIPAELILA